ncbi:MAG TPA: tyrosine-type recombinase/integrase [Ruminococcus flavefaciens]|nr:tyrosine-type recombinase/integrase [Ruminococcus flavefaciens]
MADLNARKRGQKWEYYFETARIGGKRKRISKGGFNTKAEAISAGAKAMNEYLNSGTVFVPSEVSVHDYLDHWIKIYCIPNLKPTTVANYKKHIRLHIAPKIGMYLLSSISSEQLQSLINEMVSQGYSKNTIISIKGILSSSFNYAVQPLHYLKTSPMVYVKIPKGSRSNYKASLYVRDVIEKDIIDRIFKRFPKGTSAYLPMILAYHCGLRLGEAFAVTWDNVDFDNKTITISKQLQWHDENRIWYLTPPKYNSVRTIDIDKFVIDLLSDLRKEQAANKEFYDEFYTTIHYNEHDGINDSSGEVVDFINVYENGGFIQPRIMQHTSTVIHEFCPAFNFHSLRHTHCTLLLEAGLPLKYVQKRLGHKNINVTMNIYNHLTKNQAMQGKQALEEVFK